MLGVKLIVSFGVALYAHVNIPMFRYQASCFIDVGSYHFDQSHIVWFHLSIRLGVSRTVTSFTDLKQYDQSYDLDRYADTVDNQSDWWIHSVIC